MRCFSISLTNFSYLSHGVGRLSNFVALLCCMTCLIIVLARLKASSSYLGDVDSDWR